MTLQRVVAVLVAIVVLALTGALAWFVYSTPGTVFDAESERRVPQIEASDESVFVTVAEGESASDIGGRLYDEGIIRSARLFEILVGVMGVQDSLEAGDYEFDRGITAVEAVDRIAEGRTASRQVVIPEGRRVEEVGQILEDAGIVTRAEFLAALDKTQYDLPFLRSVQSASLEGFVFPARYEFFRTAGPEIVVETMLIGFQNNIADAVQLEGQDLTLEEVVTLASIVEREAQEASERPLIASVFLNRLRLGIPLQADPTVQFAITQDPANIGQFGYWKRGLTLDDLKFESPYNTYVEAGLPPGPIANPGLDSIEAVVRPAQTNYLFFVSRNDGTHVFAETLEEHLRNVEIYQVQ